MQTNLQCQKVHLWWPGEERWRDGEEWVDRELQGVMDVFIILIVVVVLCMYSCVKTLQIVPSEGMQLLHVIMLQ